MRQRSWLARSQLVTDAGSASLNAMILTGLVVAIALGAVGLTSGVAERRHMQAVADAWALTGASAVMRGEDGCARIQRLDTQAGSDHRRLTQCVAEATHLTIELGSTSGRPWSSILRVRSRAGLALVQPSG